MTRIIPKSFQKRPPGRNVFLDKMEIFFCPGDMESIGFSYEMSKYGHREERRDDGSRYFDHPKSVAWIYFDELGGRDPRIVRICIIHDVKENSYILTYHRISLNFDREEALDNMAITKIKGETVEDYLQRIIARGARVIIAKLCDVLHNVRTLYCCSEEKIAKQVKEIRETVAPTLLSALEACGEEYLEIASKLREKIDEALQVYSPAID
ncbi:MAG: hypothetical protein HGA61_02230 [Candidatus Moranbacteria bacterium]|nr:hypothetical protein [Candidatus Moranbacteria bacterium]